MSPLARRRQDDPVTLLALKGLPLKALHGSWKRGRRASRVIGLSAALEWLSDIDIEQAENWSRGWRRWRKTHWRRNARAFRSFRCGLNLLVARFVGVRKRCGDAAGGIRYCARAGQLAPSIAVAELGVTGTLRALCAVYYPT